LKQLENQPITWQSNWLEILNKIQSFATINNNDKNILRLDPAIFKFILIEYKNDFERNQFLTRFEGFFSDKHWVW